MQRVELSTNPADYPIIRVSDWVENEQELEQVLSEIEQEQKENDATIQ